MKHFKLMKGVLACLLSLALVFSCFSGVGAQAADDTTTTVAAPNACEATYNPNNDTLVSSTGKVVYVLSKESGNTIKAGAKCYEMSTKPEENTLAAMGVKGTTKDAYFYVCDKQFEAEGTNIKANVVVKAQAAKKIVANIDYTQADDDNSETVLSITATDNAKKKIEGATCIWSEDGTTWKAANEFKGSNLKKMLEAGGAIQVKMLGTTENGNVRTSKAIKVKIAKMGKAPAVKIDVKKDTFGIKNGMDFAIFTKSGENYTNVSGWRTVLPNLKTAKIKTVENSIVRTATEYLPLDKKDTAANNDALENKVSYTQAKVKAIGYKTIYDIYAPIAASGEATTKYYLGVRSSATSKKPASDVSYVEFTPKTEAPIVYTESCVSGQYLVSSGKEFAKKGFTLSTIANYNGENGTTGFDDTFKLKEKNEGADTNTASYEYTIVKYSDIVDSGSGANIDWTSVAWKKLDPAKTKINGKLKSKYVTTAGTKVTAELKAGSISGAPTADVPSDIQTVMLVRRAGVKGSVLASEYQILYVAKDGSDFGIYSTKSVGEEAWKYTVKFAKYEAPSTSSSGGWTVASDISEISVWMQPGDANAKYVELPKIDGAALFTASATGSGSGMTITASTSGVATETGTTNKGKYKVTLSTSGDTTEYIAVKQYANIKVVATGSGETVPEKEIGLVKAGKISSVSGDKLIAGTTVAAYVGETVTIDVLDYAAPAGYVTSGSGVVTATGTGYTDAALANSKITVIVNTADEVTVTVKYPVVKTYTIKFDANGATGTLTTTSLTTDKDGKIALPNEATGLTAPNGKAFKGWGLAKDTAESAKQTSDSIYTADTTLYAIWAES